MPRRCVVCKEEIDSERAELLPETRLCVTHAGEIQKFGGEFIISTVRERTSKEGSLKKNYGSVSTEKTRNQEAIDRLRDDYERRQFDEKS